MPKNAKHTSIKSVLSQALCAFYPRPCVRSIPGPVCVLSQALCAFYPRPCVRFLHYSCACVAYFGFLICVANPACIIGNQTLYCRSAGPVLWKGRGRVCWSMRGRLSVWTRVGRSAQILGIVTRPILAKQYHAVVSIWTKIPHAIPSVLYCVLSVISLPGKLPLNLNRT